MNPRITMRLVALALLVLAIVLGPAPRALADNAATSHREDAGYDDPIIIRCDSGRVEYLYEGQRSWAADKCPGGTSAIYVRAREDLVCMWLTTYYGWQWTTIFREEGWHPVGPSFSEKNAGCVVKLNQ